MANTQAENLINAKDLSIEELNNKVKDLILKNYKQILILHPKQEENLLQEIVGNIKIEIIGNVGHSFSNLSEGLKIIVNGNVEDSSLIGFKNSKITIFGSCGKSFGAGFNNSEAYIFQNCGASSFSKITNSKVIIGGIASDGIGSFMSESIIVLLNLKGGTIFIDDSYIKDFVSGRFYIRGEHKILSERLTSIEANEKDEDFILPLTSEYARQFGVSLSEVKSKPFYKIESK